MTLVFDRRAELGDGPGTHALLCGISEYPYLPGGREPTTPFSFGMHQLDPAARTVRAVHDWLVDRADDLAAPLATTRLLVAPLPGDEDVSRDVDSQPPTLDGFLRAAAAWREDASAHPEGVAIFYFCGHGFMISRADQLVLLADYGEGFGSILHNAINMGSIVQGMAPTEWTPDMARTQLYFVDSGQRFEPLPPELGAATATQVFNLPLEPGTDRVAITFSPGPGEMAYGRVGGLSIFGASLLECLQGAAAERVTDGWAITTLGLVRALPETVKRQGAPLGLRPEVTAGGLIGPALVARLPHPPQARLAITVPAEAAPSATVTVFDASFSPVHEQGPGLDRELAIDLPSGLYVVELKGLETAPKLETVAAEPSKVTRVDFEPAG